MEDVQVRKICQQNGAQPLSPSVFYFILPLPQSPAPPPTFKISSWKNHVEFICIKGILTGKSMAYVKL